MNLIRAFVLLATASVGQAQKDRLRRRTTVLDRSACNDESSFTVPAGILCNFPIIVSGFGVTGLPDGATNAMLNNTLNVGVNPNTGFHRVNPEQAGCNFDDVVPPPPQCCTAPGLVSSYISRGAGANFQASDLGTFSWSGNFVLLRPGGQISFEPTFPNMTMALAEVKGKVWFEDGDAFTMEKYVGSMPNDICAELGDDLVCTYLKSPKKCKRAGCTWDKAEKACEESI